ncbi:hypothetical protein [Metabacillus fastidiosus]|uniref:hypothetical protein n=1 Tax=Metabacillus fastidiosus TaxID=1458 RepID=UPI003D29AAE1
MDYYQAAKLRKEWKEKGNPPCSHSDREKERLNGSLTGDAVCTTCGHEAWIYKEKKAE